MEMLLVFCRHFHHVSFMLRGQNTGATSVPGLLQFLFQLEKKYFKADVED